MKKMTDADIQTLGRSMANHWMLGATTNVTAEVMSNQLNVLREAALYVLGVDLANAIFQNRWTGGQALEHLTDLQDYIVGISEDMAVKIARGETFYTHPVSTQPKNPHAH